ncbi:hypothetical protein MAMC_01302 [Methylacidimicrobium cyclopophantes]|uniref:DUF3088 domain-containing protein n=1 Tax=Methylacidimicrobium cyclopophantes TaxID=1041766 RepID=A0A5E6MBB8_9BACT|nr:DUF3088 family protein [Methylacidimicrobium cyclopophantes]VVM06862.1 hypothetical protein MAMC_01302 [Methylacidimicrobium cyclopophantes]
MKDLLFLLSSGFTDGEGAPYYCPHCAIFEGLVALYPKLAEELTIRRVAYPRPRPEIVGLLGEENQSCPVLILHQEPPASCSDLAWRKANGRPFLDDPTAIGHYLARVYGVPRPHS